MNTLNNSNGYMNNGDKRDIGIKDADYDRMEDLQMRDKKGRSEERIRDIIEYLEWRMER